MLRALRDLLFTFALFGQLLRILERIDMLDFDALGIEHAPLRLRVFGRHRIAVMPLTVLVDPAVVAPCSVASRGWQASHKSPAATIDPLFVKFVTVLSSGRLSRGCPAQLSTLRGQGQVSQSATP